MDESTERRKAENEAIFREANEKIHSARIELLDAKGPTPFLCECSQPGCREVVLLELADYEFTRADATRFVVAHGHLEDADVVRTGQGWAIVAKGGPAAEVAQATDPRPAL